MNKNDMKHGKVESVGACGMRCVDYPKACNDCKVFLWERRRKAGRALKKSKKIIIGMGESQMKKDDRVAFRPDKEGKLDDVFIKDVRLFRMERMDENAWWIHCYLEGEEDWGADFWLKSPEKIEAEVHSFPAYVKYEKGCREWVLKQVKDTLKKLKRQQEAYGLSLKDVIEEVETLKSNLEGD